MQFKQNSIPNDAAIITCTGSVDWDTFKAEAKAHLCADCESKASELIDIRQKADAHNAKRRLRASAIAAGSLLQMNFTYIAADASFDKRPFEYLKPPKSRVTKFIAKHPAGLKTPAQQTFSTEAK
ncbi:MAG TPA: hypothetical protein V6C76_04320 [Drouetiella sp.]